MPPVPAPSLPSGATAQPLQKPSPGLATDSEGSQSPSQLSLLPGTSSGSSGLSEEAVVEERGRKPSWLRRRDPRGSGSPELQPQSPSPDLGSGQNPSSSRWARTGMAASSVLSAGLARILFYPTLLYTLMRDKVSGPAHRDWYHRIDSTVLLGALPLRSLTRRLIEKENVRAVITMNEEYETRFLCNTFEVYNWSPEEAVKAIADIRSHIHIRPGQVEVLKEFHKQVIAEAEKTKVSQKEPADE
uniref:Protein tyrosine phosphatase mitochondrial 1 n=1 Tax=Sarcophilus harrisii TaxID=9305 RepID=A0A7N4PSX5_SARHA